MKVNHTINAVKLTISKQNGAIPAAKHIRL